MIGIARLDRLRGPSGVRPPRGARPVDVCALLFAAGLGCATVSGSTSGSTFEATQPQPARAKADAGGPLATAPGGGLRPGRTEPSSLPTRWRVAIGLPEDQPGAADGPPATGADRPAAAGDQAADPSSARLSALSLEEALARVIDRADARPAEPGAVIAEPSPTALDRAVRAYVRGRDALAQADAAEAVRQLRLAAEYDPTSADVWRALGEAQRASGLRGAAAASFARAVALGDQSPLSMLLVGLDAQRRGNHARAAELLARVVEPSTPVADDAQPSVAWSALAESLGALGYDRAAGEAFERGLALPTRLTRPTALADELGDLARGQGERRRSAIDLTLAGDDPVAAFGHAAEAMSLPPYLRPGVDRRLVEAAMRAGDPAAAARLLLADAASRPEPVPWRVIELIARAARASGSADAAELFAAARDAHAARADLPARAELADEPMTPSVALSWRALLGALDPAREARRRALADLASDAALLPDPFSAARVATLAINLADGDRGHAPADVAAKIAAARPEIARETARALALVDPQAALESAQRPQTHPALRLGLLIELGRAEPAARFCAELLARRGAPPDPAMAPMLAAAGLAQSDAGLIESALALVPETALEPDADPATARRMCRVRAATLAAAQRPTAAYEAMSPLINPATPKPEPFDLAAAADLAASIGRVEEAVALIEPAYAADPYDSRAVTGRVNTLRRVAAEDPAPLNQLLARVRDRFPSAEVISGLAAEQELAAGDARAAEAHFIELFIQSPSVAHAGVILQLWSAREPAQRGAPIAQAIARAMPATPPAATLAAGVLMAAGRPADALDALDAAIANAPAPELRRSRELVLRTGLGRAAEADASREARLAGPSGIDETIELLDLTYDPAVTEARAVEAIYARIPPGVELTDAQRSQIIRPLARAVSALSLTQAAQRAAQLPGQNRRQLVVPNRADPLAAAALLGGAIGLGVQLAPQAHLSLIAALDEVNSPAAELAAAARAGAAQQPAVAGVILADTGQRLLTREDPAGLPLLIEAFASPSPELADETRRTIIDVFMAGAGQFGPAQSVRDAVAAFAAAGRVEPAAARAREVVGLYERADHPLTGADLAYGVATFAAFFDRPEIARELQGLALEFDPAYAWAANDLGYALLEEDGDIEAAAPLIELAARGLPDSDNVLDSLGWLRYKQGRIAGEDGARAILERAAALAQDTGTGAIWDHLGDARYLDGDQDGAAQAWQRAGAVSAAFAAEREAAGAFTGDLAAQVRATIAGVSAKLQAKERGDPAPVSPSPAASKAIPPP